MSSIGKNYSPNLDKESKEEFSKLSIDKRILRMMKSTTVSEPCKECGGDMVKIEATQKVICLVCEEKRIKGQEPELANKWTQDTWKARTWEYFNAYSVLRDTNIKSAGFAGYDTTEEQVAKAKEKAIRFMNLVLNEESPHMILSGAPGRGKSHLAMATLRNILETSKYTKKGIYVHYASFLDLVKESFDQPEKKQRVAQIKAEMMNCNVLVLDDLGVDLGSIDRPKDASPWNMEMLNLVLEARENKPLIVTTNFDEGQIKASYGERNYSRMFIHSKGLRILFNNVTDKRLDM